MLHLVNALLVHQSLENRPALTLCCLSLKACGQWSPRQALTMVVWLIWKSVTFHLELEHQIQLQYMIWSKPWMNGDEKDSYSRHFVMFNVFNWR
jgi:hypothetical protein